MPELIHVDVCPDCGATAATHTMDPPGFCRHDFERYVPVRYIPAEVDDEMVERVVKAREHVIPCDDDDDDGPIVLSRGAIRAILEAALSRSEVSR